MASAFESDKQEVRMDQNRRVGTFPAASQIRQPVGRDRQGHHWPKRQLRKEPLEQLDAEEGPRHAEGIGQVLRPDFQGRQS